MLIDCAVVLKVSSPGLIRQMLTQRKRERGSDRGSDRESKEAEEKNSGLQVEGAKAQALLFLGE